MADAIGPVWVGGFEKVTVSQDGVEYAMQFLPDKNNEALQAEGKAPVFYWLPNALRLALKPNGDFRLSFLHFLGVQDGQTNIGVKPGQTRETSGGVLSFAMTGAPPTGVLPAAHAQILERAKAKSNDARYWHVQDNFAAPQSEADIRPVPIRSSTLRVMITDQDGEGVNDASNEFYVNAQGGGAGGLSPFAEHPFIINLGTFAAAQVDAGLRSVEAPVAVKEDMTLALWAPVTELHMESNWERVFEHFTVQANLRYWWNEADLKATWNTLRAGGNIKVHLKMDRSIPGADNQEDMIQKYIDMLVSMWLEQAKQIIFQPMPQVQDPAPPRGGGGFLGLFGWGFGGGVSLNFQRDKVEMANSFDFSLDQIYPQPHTMGGSVDGIADLLAKDPTQEKKYMRKLFLDNWDRKITTVCRPVVNWEDPVKFVHVQVSYPDENGELQGNGHDFTRPPEPATIPAAGAVADGTGAAAADTTPEQPASSPVLVYGNGTAAEVFFARMTQKSSTQVANAPEGWAPNKVFVKRTLHFDERPFSSEDGFKKTLVDQGVVELDPGEHGTLTDSLSVEVRADSAGTLQLGPMRLRIPPSAIDDTVFIEVEFQITGKPELPPRAAIRYEFSAADLKDPRFLTVYTGRPEWQPGFKYQVRVTRGGSLDIEPEEWLGPVIEEEGGGELRIAVPAKTSPGVTVISG